MFAYHKLIQEKDGIIIELYLEQQWSEFAKEFDKYQPEYEKNLQNVVKQYIGEKLPGIKAKAVKIMLGSILVASIPFGHVYAAETAGVTSIAQSQYPAGITYTVQHGDTLFHIAQRFRTTIERIKSLNGLSGNIIGVGQQLLLPGHNKEIYIVQTGDTLYVIAKRLGTSVEQIKLSNELKSDRIFVGQWLRVTVQRQKAYIVRYGDTLYNIAGKYGIPLELLKAVNGLSSNNVYVGQSLIIPITGVHFVASNPDGIMTIVNKSYSLSSHYVPSGMVVPNIPFTSKEYSDKKLVRQEAANALERLFYKAKQEGINLYAISGYRSYQRQEEIFTRNISKYGSAEAANRFSAKPGESEHQTGLAMDVTGPSVNNTISQAFGETLEGKWLKENAAEFGFIIRYPKGMEGVTGYQYEPWHIRYVGVEHAKVIYAKGITLEQYVGKY